MPGVPVKVVTEQAGHATSAFTMDVCGHVGAEHRKVMADAVGAALGDALSTATGEQVANRRPPKVATIPPRREK
jgi:hypothetical protein